MATQTTSDDPRLSGEYVRECPGGADAGDVVLVGAVHDHPASKYRAKSLADALDPDVLALELPPLAMPLFEQYADDGRTPPVFGGEMSAAIQAASTDRTVGIDGPTLPFAARLARTLYREDVSRDTTVATLNALASVTKHSVVCRLAAAVAERRSINIEVDVLSSSYETDWQDDPGDQAEDEHQQVRMATSVLQAFGSSPSTRLRNTTREGYMADRLSTLREEGDVVAVVGIDHLDPLAERIGRSDL